MPRTIETIAASHSIATARRAQRLPIWDERIRIREYLWDDSLTFEQKRDAVVAAIKASNWYRSSELYSDLRNYVDDLAEAADGDEYDEVMDAIYDEADVERVFIG